MSVIGNLDWDKLHAFGSQYLELRQANVNWADVLLFAVQQGNVPLAAAAKAFLPNEDGSSYHNSPLNVALTNHDAEMVKTLRLLGFSPMKGGQDASAPLLILAGDKDEDFTVQVLPHFISELEDWGLAYVLLLEKKFNALNRALELCPSKRYSIVSQAMQQRVYAVFDLPALQSFDFGEHTNLRRHAALAFGDATLLRWALARNADHDWLIQVAITKDNLYNAEGVEVQGARVATVEDVRILSEFVSDASREQALQTALQRRGNNHTADTNRLQRIIDFLQEQVQVPA